MGAGQSPAERSQLWTTSNCCDDSGTGSSQGNTAAHFAQPVNISRTARGKHSIRTRNTGARSAGSRTNVRHMTPASCIPVPTLRRICHRTTDKTEQAEPGTLCICHRIRPRSMAGDHQPSGSIRKYRPGARGDRGPDEDLPTYHPGGEKPWLRRTTTGISGSLTRCWS